MRLLRTVVGVVLTALALPAAAASDSCDESLLTCDYSQSTVVVPMDLEQLTATVAVQDRNGNGLEDERTLYAQILPEGYDIPATPQVAFQIVDLYSGRREFGGYYGREGSIAIKTVHIATGEEGWYHLSTPTDSQTAYDIGRPAGLPKTLMDSMSLSARGSGYSGGAVLGGQDVFSLDFTPGGQAVAGDLRRWTLVNDPYLLQNPPLEGGLYRLKYTTKPYVPLGDVAGSALPPQAEVVGVTSLPEPQPGAVNYSVTPTTDTLDAGSPERLPDIFPAGSDLDDLIPVTGTAQGAYVKAAVLLVIQQRDL